MLKQRVITAVCLGIVFAWVVFSAGNLPFTVSMGVVAATAGWEWARLSGLRSTPEKMAYALLVTLCAMSPAYLDYAHTPPLLACALVTGAWMIASAFLLRNVTPRDLDNEKSIPRLIAGVLLLTTVTWSALWLRNSPSGSPLFLVYALSIVWVADIGAYFVGKAFGRKKLASNISPGKTVERLAGGMNAVAVWTALAVAVEVFDSTVAALILASLVAGLLSVAGDLMESYLKRSVRIKDSGRILPGHGGVLDRIDGVLAALPVFTLIVLLF